MRQRELLGAIAYLALGLALGACSSFKSIEIETKKVDYKSAGKLPPLEIPPDLTRPGSDERFTVPEVTGATTYSEYNRERSGQQQQRTVTSTVLPPQDNVRVERQGNVVHVYQSAIRSHFTPDVIRVKQGDTVHWHLTSLEQAYDATHGFALHAYNINLSVEPGEHNDVTFKADIPGVFPLYCTEFCSALHLEMAGYLLVEPRK